MENTDKLTKAEIVTLLAEKEARLLILEAEHLELTALKQTQEDSKTAKDAAIRAEWEIRKENEKLVQERDALTAERNALKIELDLLADLFNANSKAFKDQTLMLGVFVDNAKNIEHLQEIKIAQYNSRGAIAPKEIKK